MALLDLLGRRWSLRVLWELAQVPGQTFRELQERCGGVSSSVLTTRISELTTAGIVVRAARGYELTADGRALIDDLAPLDAWAKRWARRASER
jgi:DNA-binding HxlR family transcriptional regulator